ncbi:MAG: alpha-xylosidase, partial [Anaerolineae bacterium]|nr:alpha-xylosidase [Anaerolineae bacterium]
EEAVDVLRLFTKLKCRLMPYLYAQALVAAQQGLPMMRATMLEFPDDPTCDYLDRQYMLGDSLLVAPVFAHGDVVTYYLPAGRWTNFLTGEVVAGPGWQRETHSFLSLPLMVRPNSIIAVGSQDNRPDYDYGHGVTLRLYALADGQQTSTIIPSPAGTLETTFDAQRKGAMITVERQGLAKAWQLLLVGLEPVAAVDGGVAESTPQGVLVTPTEGADCLKISLA